MRGKYPEIVSETATLNGNPGKWEWGDESSVQSSKIRCLFACTNCYDYEVPKFDFNFPIKTVLSYDYAITDLMRVQREKFLLDDSESKHIFYHF